MSAILNPKAQIRPAESVLRLARGNPFPSTLEIAAISRKDDGAARKRKPRRYALGREISRAVDAMRANGIVITSVDLHPDGTIRFSSASIAALGSASEFERWDKAGRL